MHELLLKGGTVIDPINGTNGVFDIAIDKGFISAVEPLINIDSRRTLDVTGKIVVPGIIDIHTHVLPGITPPGMGLHPDLAGVKAGVTTIVDAGSSGSNTYRAFPLYLLPSVDTEILLFLHIARGGFSQAPEIQSPSSIDLEGTIQASLENTSLIGGIKVRMTSSSLEAMGMEFVKIARKASHEANIPMMVHIGDDRLGNYDSSVIRQTLNLLEKGDIVTHSFTSGPGGLLDRKGQLLIEAKEAHDRGVWFDTAFGRGNHFGFDVAHRIMDQGLLPHTISTDITVVGRQKTVHSMVEMMTRFLAMGFTLEEVITMSTSNPARVIRQAHRLGSLEVGRQADISVLDLLTGDWVVYDVEQFIGSKGLVRTSKALVPVVTVKRGRVFEPEWGPRSWGWEPDAFPQESN